MAIQKNPSSNQVPSRRAISRVAVQVWQWCSTKQALLLLLTPLALALIASTILPQVPTYIHSDALEFERWLAERQIVFKNWTPLLTTIGAFYIREAIWFRLLLTLLTFVLLVALGEQARILFSPTSVCMPIAFYSSSDVEPLNSPLDLAQTADPLRQALRRPTLETDQQNHIHLYSARRPWARACTALRYLGLLLLVGNLAVQTRWGWKRSGIQVLPYKAIALGPQNTHRLQLISLTTGTENGQATPTAELQIADQTILPIQFGIPVRHRGYRYLWVSRGGPSVQLTAQRVSEPEQSLTLYYYAVRPDPKPALQFTFSYGQELDHQFILSEDKVIGGLRWNDKTSAQDKTLPEFYLWAIREDGEELGVEPFVPIEPGQDPVQLEAVIGDVAYRLQVAQYIVLDVTHRPLLWLPWLGGILLVLGFLGLLIPQQEIWVRIEETAQVTVHARERRRGLAAGRAKETDTLHARLQDILQSSTLSDNQPIRQETRDSSGGAIRAEYGNDL